MEVDIITLQKQLKSMSSLAIKNFELTKKLPSSRRSTSPHVCDLDGDINMDSLCSWSFTLSHTSLVPLPTRRSPGL